MAVTTVAINDNFDGLTTNAVPGGSWTEEDGGTDWKVQTAPSGMSGNALRSVQTAGDNFLRYSFTRVTSGLVTVRCTYRTGSTVAATSNRWGRCYVYDGANPVTALDINGSDGAQILVSPNNTTLTSVTTNTVYAMGVTVDLTNKKVVCAWVNDTVYRGPNGDGWTYYPGAAALGIDRIRLSSYSPTVTAGQYIYVDDVSVYMGMPDRSTQTSARQAVTRAATR